MRYCPTCQKEMNGATDLCPDCGHRFVGATGNREFSIVKPAVRPKIQCDVELGVTVDRTGSSTEFAGGIPATVEIILRQVASKARHVTCYVQSHGDLDELEDFVLHTDGGTCEQAIHDIRGIHYCGGGDPEESHLDALENLLNTIPWTADPARARGAILGFMTDDTKPARSGNSARAVGAEIKSRGLLLYLVCEPTPTLHDLVEGASGLMFQISNSPDPADLQQIAGSLAASIVASVASGSTVPMNIALDA